MEKKNYIQPEMKVVGLSSMSSLMLLGSPTASEPGKSNSPQRLVETAY